MKKDYLRASLKTNKELVFCDMDGVLCEFDKMKELFLAEGHKEHEIFKKVGFFLSLPPIENAVEAIKKLDEKYDVYILSTAPWSSPDAWKEKRLWVETHIGKIAKKKLILSHNKGLFTGRALIDDRIANGVADFKGEHIHFGISPFENWNKILNYLL